MASTIVFVRHGESELNLDTTLVMGKQSHSPLTGKGVKQAETLGEYWRKNNTKFDLILSSTFADS